MKTIFRIARAELSTLFYSPVAWMVLIIFAIQSSLTFVDTVSWLQSVYQAGESLSGITKLIIEEFFIPVQEKLYLCIPLITMGLMSREISSGSIKLLLSSPVKLWEIIAGKYLAMMIYGLLFIGILDLLMIAGLVSVASFDIGSVLSGLLGLYLLICAYAAIGLFISCLTSYQVVAAIGTLAVFAGLNYISGLGQNIAFFRAVTYFLTLSDHTTQLFKGLVSSQDVFYFLLVILLFLTMAVFKLLYTRQNTSAWRQSLSYGLLVTIILAVGYITSVPSMTLYADLSAAQSNTISLQSQEMLRKLPGPLKITNYGNLLEEWVDASPERSNETIRFWTPYLRFKTDIQLENVLYYDRMTKDGNERESAVKTADAYEADAGLFLSPFSIGKKINLKGENKTFVRQLEIGNRKTFLRNFDEMRPNPTEREIMVAIQRLTTTAPKIFILTGHQERSLSNIKERGLSKFKKVNLRYSPVNQGFDVDSLNLSSQEIPKDISVLIIADPQVMMAQHERDKLAKYIKDGGNLLIAGDYGTHEIINPLLMDFGVQLNKGLLIQQHNNALSPFIVSVGLTRMASVLLPDSRNGQKFGMNGACGLSYSLNQNFKASPLAFSDEVDTWNTMANLSTELEYVAFNPSLGDTKTSVPVAIALTRDVNNRKQKIIVLSDADVLANRLYETNSAFLLSTFKWFNNGVFPVNVSRPEAADNDFLITKNGISVIRWLFVGVLPCLLLISGTLLLLHRRRK